jgi:hypothetical protein
MQTIIVQAVQVSLLQCSDPMRWARRTGSLSASPLLQRGANEPAGVQLPWECGGRVAARHTSAARRQRRRAPPIILSKRLRVGGVAKGFPTFQGFGVIERAELIAQYDARQGCSFPNFVFDIAVFLAGLDRCRPSRIGTNQAAVDKTPDNQHWRSTTRSRLCRGTCATGDLRLLQRSKPQVRIAGGQGGRAHRVGLWRRLSVGLGNPTLIGRRR